MAAIPQSENSVAVGHPASFKCVATGHPKPKVEWSRNGEALVPNERTVLTEDTLLILKARLEDSGSYTCVAQNKEGLNFASAHLLVGCKSKLLDLWF